MKNNLLLILAILLSLPIMAQRSKISGVVKDANGDPILGANVVEKGTQNNASTGVDGRFELTVLKALPATIRISAVGSKTQEIEIFEALDEPLEIILKLDNLLSEVVITSRRREETAQDVPIPISIIGGSLVEETGAFNVNRVKELVPTVQLYSSNPRNTTLNIRGLGSTFGLTNDGLDPGVGFYIDGVYFARPAATTLDFIDVDRIEVLRGPQGTLFGKNTTAGAFNIVTRGPSFDPSGAAELSYGNYGFIQAKASFTGPLSKKFATRISFSGTQRDGTIYNTYSSRYVNDLNNLGINGKLLYQPNNNVKVTLAADATRQQPNEGYAQVIAGVVETKRPAYRQFRNIISDLNWQIPSENPFDRLVNQNSTWRSGNDLGGISLNLDAKVGKGTLTSTSAWRYWDWDPMNDRDFTGLNATALSQAPSKHRNWSQEVRYAGDFANNVSGVIGVYAIGQVLKTDPVHTEAAGEHQWRFQQSTTNTALWRTPGLFDGHRSEITSTLESFGAALFTNIDWKVSEKFHVLPGLRYNYDTKTVDFKRLGLGLFDTTGHPQAAQLAAIRTIYNNQQFNFTANESNLTGQLTITYKAAENINTFATYSTSFKPIGVNLGGLPNVAGQPDLSLAQIKPEYVSHYEIGVKTTPNKQSTFNIVAHYTNITDYQTLVQDPDPSILRGYLANADEVRVTGVEIDASTRIGKNISIFGAFAYTDGKYISFKNAPLPLEDTGLRNQDGSNVPFVDISGGRLPGISKWAGNIGGELLTNQYSLLGRDGKFFIGIDTYYRSDFSSSPSPSKYLNIDGYSIFNARVGFRATDGFTLSLWGRNIFDTNYFELLLPGAGNAGHYAAVLGDPRTVGATLRFSF